MRAIFNRVRQEGKIMVKNWQPQGESNSSTEHEKLVS